jgi:hypothetical protein
VAFGSRWLVEQLVDQPGTRLVPTIRGPEHPARAEATPPAAKVLAILA